MPDATFCTAPIDSPVKGDICGHRMPCPQHGRGVYCAMRSDSDPTSVCGAELPCPRHSALSDGLTIDGTVPEPARCSAHGKTVAEHTGEYANDCTAPPPSREGVPMGHCPSCEYYADTRMHWDTCQYRGRNVRGDLLLGMMDTRELAERGWTFELPGAPRDPELRALAVIVAELQQLNDAERGRILRYLNHRYTPSDRGPGSAPPQ